MTMLAIGFVVGLVVIGLAIVLYRSRADAPDHTPSPPPVAPPSGAVEEQARALKAQGHTIAAIKLVREATGMGLAEAKRFVDGLAVEGVPSALSPTPSPSAGDPAALAADPEVRALLARGNKIAAIKRVRELTGWGLKEAKEFVERLEL